MDVDDIAGGGFAEVRDGTSVDVITRGALTAAGDPPEDVYAEVTVSGPPDQVSAFLALCDTVDYLGSVGASRVIRVDADGDGALRLRFDFGDTEVERAVEGSDLDTGDDLYIGLGASAAGRFLTRQEVLAGDFGDLIVTDPAGTSVPFREWVGTFAGEQDPAPEDVSAGQPAEQEALAEPTHAGMAVQATDTGRILMIQRSLDQDDPPEVRGTWEFPGGGIEDGETPEQAAWREFSEETGLPAPPGEVTGGWRSPNGVYQGFVFTTPTEADAFPDGINPDYEAAVMDNPDDPGRRVPDVQAWWTLEQIQALGEALRPEVHDTPWDQFAPTPAGDAQEDSDMSITAAITGGRPTVVRRVTGAFAVTALADVPPDAICAAPDCAATPTHGADTDVADWSCLYCETHAAAYDGQAPPGLDGWSAGTVTAAAGDPAPTIKPTPPVDPIGMEGSDDDDQFYGVAVVENSQTGDGRVFLPSSIVFDVPMPIPLGWQVQDAPGHDGSVVCGRFDTFTRFGNLIAYTGTWDLDGAGWETRRLVEGQFLTGLSVDTDDFDAQVVDMDGNPVDPFMIMGDDVDLLLAVAGARIRSAALCRVPAFTEAFIANGTPPPGWAGERPGDPQAETPEDVPEEEAQAAIVAAAVAARNPAAPTLPAGSDYANPGFTEATPLTVTDDGRVYGHLAAWGTCHIGIDGRCVEPPVSDSNYALYAKGYVQTDTGPVRTGRLTIGTGHAPLTLGLRAAAEHYDNTGSACADVAIGQDGIGIWFAGRVVPGTTPETIYQMRAAGAVSGDWREWAPGDLELVAALVVNVPGFPVPRVSLAASAVTGCQSLVAAGMVRRPGTPAPDPGPNHEAVVASVLAAIDRRDRAREAAARLTVHGQAARQRRLTAVTTRLARKG